MDSYKEYRYGSPVEVAGKPVIIEEIHQNGQEMCGYKITGSAMEISPNDVYPIEITPEILKSYGFVREGGYWKYIANKHTVLIGDDYGCSVDGEFKDYVPNLHELKNLLYDKCGRFTLRNYYGIH